MSMSLITYVDGTEFCIFLIIKASSGQFWVYPLAKMSLYFGILTQSPTVNLGSFSLEPSLYSA